MPAKPPFNADCKANEIVAATELGAPELKKTALNAPPNDPRIIAPAPTARPDGEASKAPTVAPENIPPMPPAIALISRSVKQ